MLPWTLAYVVACAYAGLRILSPILGLPQQFSPLLQLVLVHLHAALLEGAGLASGDVDSGEERREGGGSYGGQSGGRQLGAKHGRLGADRRGCQERVLPEGQAGGGRRRRSITVGFVAKCVSNAVLARARELSGRERRKWQSFAVGLA